jgi:hypothetical protein
MAMHHRQPRPRENHPMTTDETGPERGDVLSVGYADQGKAAAAELAAQADDPVERLVRAQTPDDDERVAVRLAGYPFLFVVRVRAGRTGPVVTHLEITADDGQVVEYGTLRSVPLRRLALSAWNWLQRFGGTVRFPGDHAGKLARPDDPDADRLTTMVQLIESAILSGLPVRKTVAAQMQFGTATIDRMIRKARGAGLMDGIEIPRRPGPKQRDTALLRHLTAVHLDTHGPDAPPSPELTELAERVRNAKTVDEQ